MAVQVPIERELVTGGDPDARANVPIDALFDGNDSEFLPADDLERIAHRLIQRHDSTFAFAENVEITYLWKRAGGSDGGKARVGKCTKLTGLAKHGIRGDFVIWLAADHCRDFGLTAWQLEAALFHELCHVGYDDEADKPSVAPHDFAGFVSELEQYGAWQSDLERMGRAAQQMTLPDFD